MMKTREKNRQNPNQYRLKILNIRRPGIFLVLSIVLVGQLLLALPPNELNDNEMSYLQWAIKTADSFIQRSPDFRITYETNRKKHKWQYEQGLMLNALYELWHQTGDQTYFDFIIKNIDQYVNDDGSIQTYKQSDYKLDDIGPGRTLLRLYKESGNPKYKKAADQLRTQLENQPRTGDGGFWHKKIYSYQMWLDGLYMAVPFYTEHALIFNQPDGLDDVIKQFCLIEQHNYDAVSGLYHHGWDEKKEQVWADPKTGLSLNFWGRGIGWYLMALVDVLEILPDETPNGDVLLVQFQDLTKAVANVRDPDTKVWYQVLDQGDREGNYLESSASAMFIYSFAKAANRGYLSSEYFALAEKSFEGFINEFVTVSDSGLVDVLHACSGAGLGGKDQRDGSFEYYISEPQRTNDYKAIGPFILAAIELGKGQNKHKP